MIGVESGRLVISAWVVLVGALLVVVALLVDRASHDSDDDQGAP